MRFRLVRLLLPMIILLSPGAASARELFVVGTTFSRIYEQAPDGQFTGLGVDVLRVVARQMGYELRFGLYPWLRAQAMVERGEADILVGPYKTPERELRFSFSRQPFFRDRLLFFVRKGSNIDWDGNYASLRGKRIGTVYGWAYGDDFDRSRAQLDVSNANTLKTGMVMLANGRIDMLAANERDADGVIRQLKMGKNVFPLERGIEVRDAYFAFPRSAESASMQQQFNEILQAMIERGELERLAQKHRVLVPQRK